MSMRLMRYLFSVLGLALSGMTPGAFAGTSSSYPTCTACCHDAQADCALADAACNPGESLLAFYSRAAAELSGWLLLAVYAAPEAAEPVPAAPRLERSAV